MDVNDRVRVSPKEALAPYEGTVQGAAGDVVDVRSDDGTVRTHQRAHCTPVGGDHTVVLPPAPTADLSAEMVPKKPRKPRAKRVK